MNLPRTIDEALAKMAACTTLSEVLGSSFVSAYLAIKRAELNAFDSVVTPWERQHLLLKV